MRFGPAEREENPGWMWEGGDLTRRQHRGGVSYKGPKPGPCNDDLLMGIRKEACGGELCETQ